METRQIQTFLTSVPMQQELVNALSVSISSHEWAPLLSNALRDKEFGLFLKKFLIVLVHSYYVDLIQD